MYDLIYGNAKAEEIMEKQYPNAKIEDASDEIHTERFGVSMKDDEYDENEYLKFLLKSGLYKVSFSFQMMMVTEECFPKLEKATKEFKQEQIGGKCEANKK